VKTQKKDRRSERTRQLLSEALIQLMVQRQYDLITVQDVIDKANVGRSTFYAHYQDKEDLLTSSFERVLAMLNPHVDRGDAATARLLHTEGLFQHVKDHHYLYKALMWGQGLELLFKKGQAYLSRNIEEQIVLLTSQHELPVPLSILSNYLAGTLLTLLKWWLDNNMPYTPQRMDEIFQQLVMPGMREVLQGK
jgi:AcrR family transcriptional regulator